MAKDITVGLDALTQASTEFDAAQTELDGELKSAQGVVNGLKTTGFDTRRAGPAFQDAQTQWFRAMAELTSSLKDFSRATKETGQKHEQADSTLAEGVNRIGGPGSA